MYIGKLNEKYERIEIHCFKKDLKKTLTASPAGNPFLGEEICFDWSELTSRGVDLYVSLSDEYYIGQIVVYLGEKSSPDGIRLYGKDKLTAYDSYHGETGKGIAARVVPLSLEGECSDFVLEFDSDFSSVRLEKIEIYGADFRGEKVYPTPSEIRVSEKKIPLTRFFEASFDSPDGEAAFRVLSDKLEEKCGVQVKQISNGFLRILNDPLEKKNGYALSVTESGATLSASDRKGFVQGVETLIKLIDRDGVPLSFVKDAPFCEFRGVHLFLPAEEEMAFTKRLIRDLLSPMGYNFIIMQFSAGMRLDSHPEINEGFLTAVQKSASGEWPPFPHASVGGGKIVSKESVRDLVTYAKGFGIEVIPEIQSLGHVQYMTLSHPEIAEIPETTEETTIDERAADTRPEAFYHHSACPSNPKTYEILFDVLDEILDVVKPSEYVHMGHDEVYEIGVCPRCKGLDPSELYARDVKKIYDYLKEKGLKMMIWADMLQPVSGYPTVSAVDKIPKDILLLDFIWYFRRAQDIEENLLSHGFQVLFGNMYSSHFTRFENRIRKDGVRGGEISAWVKTSEAELAKEGKLYDFLYGAEMLWSDSYTGYSRFSYDKIISKQIPYLRSRLQFVSYPSLESGARRIFLKEGKKFTLAGEKDGAEFPARCALRSIRFSHACTRFCRRMPWVDFDVIGRYRVVFTDGTSSEIPLTYGGNISHWDRRQNEPFAANFYRHNGYSSTFTTDGIEKTTPAGKRATLYVLEWINPFPEKKIEKIVFKEEKGADTGVIVYQIEGIR